MNKRKQISKQISCLGLTLGKKSNDKEMNIKSVCIYLGHDVNLKDNNTIKGIDKHIF